MDPTSLALLLNSIGLGGYVPLIMALIGVASAVAAFLPRPAAGSVLAPVRAFIDVLGMNFGQAKNAAVAAPTPAASSIAPVAALLLVAMLGLAACSTTPALPTMSQTVFAAELAYTTAARAEVLAAPALSPVDRGTMQHLDEQAYQEIVKLRVPAATGSTVAIDTTAAMQAVTAITNFLAAKAT